MNLPRSVARFLAPALIAAFVAACSSSGPRPPVVVEPDQPDLVSELPPDESGFSREVRGLTAAGQSEAAEEMLRARMASADRPEPVAEIRLLLAEVLAAAGRDQEALVELLRVSGSEGGEGLTARAWDEIATLRARGGDRRGAVRALMRAYEFAEDDLERGMVLEDAIVSLGGEDVSVLAAETKGLRANRFARSELGARRLAMGREDERVVTVLAPLSGRFEKFGEAFVLGVRLALEDRDARAVEDSAAVLPVRLVTRGTDGDLLTATRQARAAVEVDDCVAIVGPLLSVTSLGAGAVAQSYGVPLVAPTATDPELPEIGPYVLTLAADPARLTRPLANLTVNALGKTRFGVLLARDGVSPDYERAFREAVEVLGGEIVVSLTFDPGERDFRRLIERLDEENVDAVYVPGTVGNLEALAVQLDFYEFGRMILGNGGWTDPRLLDPGNLALEGAIFAVESADHPDSDFRLRLRERVWAASREEVSRFHIRGYHAMDALLLAIDEGARGGEEIAESLRLRESWPVLPEPERFHLITFRDGVLGPASWAVGFDLIPKLPPEEPEDEDAELDSGDVAPGDPDPASESAEGPLVPTDGDPRD